MRDWSLLNLLQEEQKVEEENVEDGSIADAQDVGNDVQTDIHRHQSPALLPLGIPNVPFSFISLTACLDEMKIKLVLLVVLIFTTSVSSSMSY